MHEIRVMLNDTTGFSAKPIFIARSESGEINRAIERVFGTIGLEISHVNDKFYAEA